MEIRYYASEDRLALYKIEDCDGEEKGFFFNKKIKAWEKNDDYLDVQYDTTHNDSITEEEAKALLEEFSHA